MRRSGIDRSVLKTRVITALSVLLIVLVALFGFADWGWAAFAFAVVIIACWEWSRLCQLNSTGMFFYVALSILLSALICLIYIRGNTAAIEFTMLRQIALVMAAMFWLIVAPLWLANRWRPRSKCLLAGLGWLVVFPMGVALLSLREISPWLLLSFAAIVWVADIAAYFAGRRFGRHKLAPAISPGKTVEGVLGGIIGVVVFFFVWQAVTAHTTVKNENWVIMLKSHSAVLFAVFVLLSLISVLGDLFESWMKRGAGMKDSSNLLPGHGGVLDRIDALTSTLPIAALYVTMMLSAK